MNRWLRASLQAAAGVGLLALVVHLVGTGPFRRALGVFTPDSAVAALVLGAVATSAQALRWRAVAAVRSGGPSRAGDLDDAEEGRPMGAGRAVGECYRAGVLNAVLPGGLAGDVLRAHRARRRGGWWRSATSVGVERLAGTAALLAVGAAVLSVAAGQARGWALALAVAAGVLVVVVTRALVAAPVRVHLAVWGWSVLGLAALVALFAVAAAVVSGGSSPGAAGTAVLAVLALLGMSLPVGAGGFGPREALAAAASDAAGTTPAAAVALAAGYGVLAVLSTAPGAVLLLADLAGSSRRGERG